MSSSNPYSHVISGPPVHNITYNPNVDADDTTLQEYYANLHWVFNFLYPQGNPAVNQRMPANPANHISWWCDRMETVFTGALAPDHPVRRAVEFFVPSHVRGRGDFTLATLKARIHFLNTYAHSVASIHQQPASASATSQQSASAPAQGAAPSSPIPQPSRPASGQFNLPQPSSRPSSGSFSAAMSPKKQG